MKNLKKKTLVLVSQGKRSMITKVIYRQPTSLPDRFDQFIKYLTSDVTVIKNAYKKDVIGAPVFIRSLTHEMKQSILHSTAVKVRNNMSFTL